MSSRPLSRARRAAPPARGEPKPPARPEPIDLFAPPPDDDPDAADPAALSRTATLASGRAMAARSWSEARALAALAESYARLVRMAGRGGDDSWDRPEPTEAEFEAVRRKVLAQAAATRDGDRDDAA